MWFSIFGSNREIDLAFWNVEWLALETNWDHSVIFEVSPKYCISDSFVDYEGYSISFMGFLPTVVDIMVIWIKFVQSHPFLFIDFQDFDVYSYHLLLDHIQCTLIQWPNILGSYTILFFAASDFTFITRHSQLSIISTLAQPLHSFWGYS